MQFLLVVCALMLLTPTAFAAHEPRVVVQRYVAGPGDVGCAVDGLGCVRLWAQDDETQAQITVVDDIHNPVGVHVCSPDCDALFVSICGSGTVEGLTPGDLVFVFISEAQGPLDCGPTKVGAGVSGTVTAVFS